MAPFSKGAFFPCLVGLFEEPEEPIATMLTPLVKSCGQPLHFRADKKNSLCEGAQSATEFCFSSSKGKSQQVFAQRLIFWLLFYQEKSKFKKCLVFVPNFPKKLEKAVFLRE